MIKILKLWIKKYGGKYRIVKKRAGDKIDEVLIGNNEILRTKSIKIDQKKYYLIDPEIISNKPLKREINSKNSIKMNEQEILKILKYGF